MSETEMVVLGFVEDLSDNILSGWCAGKVGDDFQITEIEILLKGNVIRTAQAADFREDLLQAGLGNGCFAFHVDLGDVISERDDIATLEVREASTHTVLRRLSDRPFQMNRPQQRKLISLADLVLEVRGAISPEQDQKLAIYATYTGRGGLNRLHEAQVTSLQEAGYRVVLVHSMADGIVTLPSEPCMPELLIAKRNVGYDFGSWWTGLKYIVEAGIMSSNMSRLILLNDSNVGIISREEILRCEEKEQDLVGITDSFQVEYHLQSYFLMCSGDLLSSGRFPEKILAYNFPEEKRDVIHQGEIELTRWAVGSGATVGSLYPYDCLAGMWKRNTPKKIEEARAHFLTAGFPERIVDEEIKLFFHVFRRLEAGSCVNPTHVFWEEMMELGARFIKKELVFTNPAGIPASGLRLNKVLSIGIATSGFLYDLAKNEDRNWRPPTN